MAFFRVALEGEYAGQSIVNVFWFRTGFEIPGLTELLEVEPAIAAEVEERYWGQATIGMKARMDPGYRLVQIRVDAHEDSGPLMSVTPFILPVDEIGTSGGVTIGPSLNCTLNAVLEPAFGPGIGLPKKGHIKFGPLFAVEVGEDGRLTSAAITKYNSLGEIFAANIILESPVAVLFPVRVRLTRVAGVVTVLTYRDLSAFVVNPVPTWLHSRSPEA